MQMGHFFCDSSAAHSNEQGATVFLWFTGWVGGAWKLGLALAHRKHHSQWLSRHHQPRFPQLTAAGATIDNTAGWMLCRCWYCLPTSKPVVSVKGYGCA